MPDESSVQLLAVVRRGPVWAPITSCVEQSFAKIDERLRKHRLHAAHHIEDRNISLLLGKYTEAGLDDLISKALEIWRQSFHKHSRVSTSERMDKGIPHNYPSSALDKYKNTERSFLKRLSADIAQKATPGSSSLLDDPNLSRPSTWSAAHEHGLQFQVEKRRKREVEANLRGLILPEEQTASLSDQSVAESKRQLASYADRIRRRNTFEARTTASLPTDAELSGCSVFLDTGLFQIMTKRGETLEARCVALRCKVVDNVHLATCFISDNPWAPTSTCLFLSACMQGAWVLSPAAFLGNAGSSVKYLKGLSIKRAVWASPSFRSDFPHEWLTILELLSRHTHKWQLLNSAEAWADAKAHAERKNRQPR